ncbi:hypothetical protein AB4Y36_03505 [Paraburkholderia sp. BR10936]|uniref:hypothetical protein n=1 Tax=Paraburkholderia sp. BR10936 TaxID=3236993 RepID=UPI0034D215DA
MNLKQMLKPAPYGVEQKGNMGAAVLIVFVALFGYAFYDMQPDQRVTLLVAVALLAVLLCFYFFIALIPAMLRATVRLLPAIITLLFVGFFAGIGFILATHVI